MVSVLKKGCLLLECVVFGSELGGGECVKKSSC